MLTVEQQLKEAMRPSLGQLLIALLLSVLIIITVNYPLLVNRLEDAFIVGGQEFGLIFEQYFMRIAQTQASYYVVMALFWSGFGIIVYVILWALESVGVRFYNRYVTSRYYTKALPGTIYRRKRTLAHFVNLLFAVMLIGGVIATTLYGLPFWLALSQQAMGHPLAGVGGLYATASVLGLAANLFLLFIVGRSFINTS